MTMSVDHNRIIKKIVNMRLKPLGLFQKGSSRMWIDDNGWFLILVEFQPSAWSKGTYLNVGVHFLWDDKDYLSFDYGCRVAGFVSFDSNEDRFIADVQSLTEHAMTKVSEYRNFRAFEYAKDRVLEREVSPIIHTLYQKLMMCGLCRDSRAVLYYEQLLKVLMCTNIEWTKKYLAELTERISPILHNSEQLYSYVCEKIDRQRLFWGSKTSMKKLSTTTTI